METIIFNNENALDHFEIWIAKEYSLPFTQEEVEEVRVDGRSGSLTKKLGTYKDINIKLELTATQTEDYRPLVRKINKWLTEIVDNKLIFSSYKQRYLKVKYVKIGNIERDIMLCGNFTVEFICEPFYFETGETLQAITNNTTIKNNGDIQSQPHLLLEGVSGNILISINGREMQFKGVQGTIDLNKVPYRVIDGSGESLTSKMAGYFPILDIGDNLIIINGAFASAKINKNTIYKN